MDESYYRIVISGKAGQKTLENRSGGTLPDLAKTPGAGDLLLLSVSDVEGSASDSASLTFCDKNGAMVLPNEDDEIEIFLGRSGAYGGKLHSVFKGRLRAPRAKGGAQGRIVDVRAEGVAANSAANAPKTCQYRGQTVTMMLAEAAKAAGEPAPAIDKTLGAQKIDVELQDGESYLEFGARLARQLGGQFKQVAGEKAVLLAAGSGKSASGKPLPRIAARAGEGGNLISYDIAPRAERARAQAVICAYYDKQSGTVKQLQKRDETGTAAAMHLPGQAASKKEANARIAAAQNQLARDVGSGRVVLRGEPLARAGGLCDLTCRAGLDGEYHIKSVRHQLGPSGWQTTLQLDQPKGGAGKDKRAKPPPKPTAKPESASTRGGAASLRPAGLQE
ncbi:phage late control D family protein [Polycladidibacter hongkongensis]|uniref:phage late control D family protein n=1 Tax=Polycladidibacter hongkongensis TaxID=1647556 RepID=UPI000831E7F9|nr:contractile injection system protein, VgrG/Pvc8 family [Pseudovibrio hongkongensis]